MLDAKKILILGANSETVGLVSAANELGVFTIVVDPSENSPAKKYAKRSFEIDAKDEGSVISIARAEGVDGLMVGVADALVGPYHSVCKKLGLPAYTTDAAVNLFTNKQNFSSACESHGLHTIPTFDHHTCINATKSLADELPVLIKPPDGLAGCGVTICESLSGIEKAIELARNNSPSRSFLCQKFMTGADVQAYYVIDEGKAHLACLIDRSLYIDDTTGGPVCLGASYLSRHTSVFLRTFNPKFTKLIESTEMNTGVLSVQCFVEKDMVYPYDPGLRIQGEAPHILLKRVSKIDHLKILVEKAVGLAPSNSLSLANLTTPIVSSFCCSAWILLGVGVIGAICGCDLLIKHPNVVQVVQRLDLGDAVKEDMIGTERQVFARVYFYARSHTVLKKAVSECLSCLDVKDQLGRSMVLAKYQVGQS